MAKINPNNKWQSEVKALKKVQVQFEFQTNLNKQITHDAAENSIKPSDVVRKIVGLPFKKIQRIRVGLSLNEDELKSLAIRYQLEPSNEKEIKRRVMAEVNLHYDGEKEKK
ncbi:MAG: hypothetical protein HOE45_11005 [Gammaproteobacteria bacterium]|jgi:hypothetical protein|nr:hypothetical protein [Gammaproteobacteria bacterium]MBT4147377.1 hypothetical protein [Gammaproteobacteria bacterium]MBT5223227.1 hypothetical protein [Gammaproteobacteria bacterium]MBT5824757.1 hypothetical protein [Gammaproteobacteria bacterium]MBT5967566.1 hypothetical protein [Gammaproteobacteria bacterium]